MRVVFLVPWRSDGSYREHAWQTCRTRWEALFPDWPIYEGASPEGPFQRAAAINDAARRADRDGRWDVAVIIDADVLLPKPNVAEAVRRASKTGKVTWAHRRWRQINREVTERLTGPHGERNAIGHLGGLTVPEWTTDIDLIVEKTTAFSWSCCIAIRRDAWDRIGGFDERFIGWGHEDGAFMASAALIGWDRLEGDVLNLWHPRVPGAGVADKIRKGRYTPQALVNGRLGMRYAVALRRDLGLTDRNEVTSPDVLERDIANLRRNDEEFAEQQAAAERERWTDWWPTIDELLEGARAMVIGKQPESATVTLVVHTGGDPANWPERRDYLRLSLASLVENVTGPIVQRVIYDCWADPAIRSELEAMAPPGFYVVGPDVSTDFTASMQAMWRYIAKRAKGEYVFQVEDDFTYTRPVDLAEMMAVLARDPHLAQLALLRDPCYPDERETGGILGWPLPAFTFRDGWFEHRQFWTLNPCLFRKAMTDRPWPSGRHSETLFGKALLRDERVRFAFWGEGEEWIRHIGTVRAGVGY